MIHLILYFCCLLMAGFVSASQRNESKAELRTRLLAIQQQNKPKTKQRAKPKAKARDIYIKVRHIRDDIINNYSHDTNVLVHLARRAHADQYPIPVHINTYLTDALDVDPECDLTRNIARRIFRLKTPEKPFESDIIGLKRILRTKLQEI